MSNNAKPNTVLQFKITLKYSKPPIWRRIQISSSATFLDLHATIQDSFGWEDYHLHQFMFGARHEEPVLIGPKDPEDWGFENDKIREKEVALSDWFQQEGRVCMYEYDFGDSWEHTVLLEKIIAVEPLATYPRCIAGKRACPPEDAGGIPGYEQKLEILRHSRSKYYRETKEWMGDFDPEHFSPKDVVFMDVDRHDPDNAER